MSSHTDPHRSPTTSRDDRPGTTRTARRASILHRIADRHSDDGVTLIEVLVASLLLIVTMIPMGILLTKVSQSAVEARQHQAAQQLAEAWIQILTNTPPPTSTLVGGANGGVITNTPTTLTPAFAISKGAQPPQSTLEGIPFTATAVYTNTLVNNVGHSDLCSAGTPPSPTHPAVIQLQVTVTWGANNAQSLSQVTNINYPSLGPQQEGFLAINLSNEGETDVFGNSAAARLEAVPVQITETAGLVTGIDPTGVVTLNPNPADLHADLNGCIFAQVPAGTYDVTPLQPTSGSIPSYSGNPAFVDTANSTNDDQPNQQVIVTAEKVTQLGGFDMGINTNLSYAGASAIDSGVSCPGAAGLTCVALGSGATGASATWGGTGAQWSSTTLAAGSHINQVDCTTAATAECVGVGYGSGGGSAGGLVVSTTTDFGTPTTDTISAPGVTDLTQVTCPSTHGCYALGTGTSGPVLLAGYVGSGSNIWHNVTPPAVPITALNSIACPTSTTCEVSYVGPGPTAGVLRLDGDPGQLSGNPSWAPTTASDVLPTLLNNTYTVTSVGTITCPSSTECLATATGDQPSTSDATVVDATIAASGPSSWAAEATFPTGAVSVTGISCSGTTCVAIGSAAPNTVNNTAAVWTGDLTTTPENWVQSNAIPASLATTGSVACGQPAPNGTAACVISAETRGLAGTGQLLVGSLAGSSWAWNLAVPPSGTSVQFYTGVACQSPASAAAAACAAVGATPNGPVVLTSSSGPQGAWSVQTPSTLSGATVSGIPVQVAPYATAAWSVPVGAGQSANATTLGEVLYPQPSGYFISAGDCPSETAVTSSLSALPGGTASATVPLGLLPLELQNNGTPVSGATLTLTSAGCKNLQGVTINQDTYNVPLSDATGMTTTSVPYGTYTYSVTVGGTAVAPTNYSLVVGPNTVQRLKGGVLDSTSYLPGVVTVPA